MENIDTSDARPKLETALIAVMGPTGGGKTSFVNLLSNASFKVGHDLESCTSQVQVAPPFVLDGTRVTLVDTPGFDDTTRGEAEILQEVTAFLAATYAEGKKLAGILYLHRISDNRVGGIARRNFITLRKLCGDANLAHLCVVTTMWSARSDAGREAEERREVQLRESDQFFKPVLDKGARMVRFEGGEEAARGVVRSLLDVRGQGESGGMRELQVLRVQEEMVDEKKALKQTDAGTELRAHLQGKIETHKTEMEEIKRQYAEEEAEVRDQDRKTAKGLLEMVEAVAKLRLEMEDALVAWQMKIQKCEEQIRQLAEENARLRREMLELVKRMTGRLATEVKQGRTVASLPSEPRTIGTSAQAETPNVNISNTTRSQPQQTQSSTEGGWCLVQ